MIFDNKFFKTVFLGLCTLGLIACQESSDYDYLMSHPEALDKAFVRCEDQASVPLQCEAVKQAHQDFYTLIDAARQDPQGIGKQILTVQTQIAEMKVKISELKKGNQVDPILLQQTETEYQNLCEKVKIMLAVVSITDWEAH